MKQFLLSSFLLFISWTAYAEDQKTTPAGYYTAAPISQPIYDAAEVAIHAVELNNWLNVNYEKLTDNQIPQMREYLYYLVDSHVKNSYSNIGIQLPNDPDAIFATLFSWSEKLGVYGGSQIYNKIKHSGTANIPSYTPVPHAFTLELESNMLRTTSRMYNWSVDIPYYFMISRMQEFQATNGQQTQFLIISTGVARHKEAKGHSQATLMFMFTPDKDKRKFSSFWDNAIGLSESQEYKKLNFNNLTSKYAFNNNTQLHNEFVYWSTSLGIFGVNYAGINGTYQHNRPHFIDFLRSIHVREQNTK